MALEFDVLDWKSVEKILDPLVGSLEFTAIVAHLSPEADQRGEVVDISIEVELRLHKTKLTQCWADGRCSRGRHPQP